MSSVGLSVSRLFPGCGARIGVSGRETTCGEHGVCGRCWTLRKIEEILRRRVVIGKKLSTENISFTLDDEWLRKTCEQLAEIGG